MAAVSVLPVHGRSRPCPSLAPGLLPLCTLWGARTSGSSMRICIAAAWWYRR